MSYRREDTDLKEIIRSLMDRVDRLERNKDRTRNNAIRIGNLVIEAEPRPPAVPTDLRITNLSTGNVTLIPTP